MSGNLWVGAKLSDKIDVIKETLVEVPITPFQIPGIVALGPDFIVKFNVIPSAQLEAGLNIGYTYAYDDFKLTFGTHQKPNSHGFNKPQIYGKVNSTVKGEANVKVEFIPKMGLDLVAFGYDIDLVALAMYSNFETGVYEQDGIAIDGSYLSSSCVKSSFFTQITVKYGPETASVASTKPLSIFNACYTRSRVAPQLDGFNQHHANTIAEQELVGFKPLTCIVHH